MKSPSICGFSLVLSAVALLTGCASTLPGPGMPAVHSLQTSLRSLAIAPSSFQSAGFVYWNPPAGSPAYNRYEETFTIRALPVRSSDYLYEIGGGFANPTADQFGMGIQSNGRCPGGDRCKIAIFNFIGNGATTTSPNCVSCSGVETCTIAYSFIVGRAYRLTASEQGASGSTGSTESWTGFVTDVMAAKKTVIGSWTITSSDGELSPYGAASFASDLGTPPSCAQEPYQKAVMGFPVGFSGKQRYVSAVAGTGTANCPQNTHFTLNQSSIVVVTGKKM